MAQENTEIVVDAYARYNAGERIPDLSFWHPDAEYHVAREDPDSDVRRGIEAIRQQFASWHEAYPDLRVDILDAQANGDRVLLWVRFVGHGAASGIPLEMELAHLYTMRDGKAAKVAEYMDRDEAREAAGLSEQATSQENVDVVRRFIEALPRAQASDDWQPVFAEVNPDVEIDDLDISLDTERYRGHDGVRTWIGVWMESWESWSLEDVQVRLVGEDRAIGLFLVRAKGKGSGIELSRRDALVCTLRAGKIEKGTYFNDQQQALEAAGLSE
jgi:ketosteroid isomerase-like protein